MEEFKEYIVDKRILFISNYGRVKNEKGFIIKPIPRKKDGFLIISIKVRKGNGRKTFYKTLLIHRIVAELFLENKHNLKQVIFADGDRNNLNVANLMYKRDLTISKFREIVFKKGA